MDHVIADFVVEARELVDGTGDALIGWEADPGDRERLDAVFRMLHTLKGTAGFLPLPRITALAHAAEDAVSQVRTGTRRPDAPMVGAVLDVLDAIALLCDSIERDGAEPAPGTPPDDASLIAALGRATPTGETGQRGDAATDAPTRPAAPDRPAVPGAAEPRSGAPVRIAADQLEAVMTAIGDMVLARDEVMRLLRIASGRDAALVQPVQSAFDRLSDTITALRQDVARLRIDRVARLFAPVPRMVRDAALALGKNVAVTVTGSDVEIDREMIDALRDPLTHLLRNAVAHGIETPQARLAAGKPEQGVIELTAQRSGNNIIVTVRDDGQGMDADVIAARAVALGLVSDAHATALSAQARLDLVFLPGFTTALAVSAMAGRGVGMDIVRSALTRIGGTVAITSDPGDGTMVTLSMPLTLTVIAGLVLHAGGRQFALSRASVGEVIDLSSDQVAIGRLGDAPVVTVRGVPMALLDLAKLDDGRMASDGASVNASGAQAPDADRLIVVVRQDDRLHLALLCDDIDDRDELVVRPATSAVMTAGPFAGTTSADQGAPVLLLDVARLSGLAGMQAAGASGRPSSPPAPAPGPAVTDASAPRPAGGAGLPPGADDGEACIDWLVFSCPDGATGIVPATLVERVVDLAPGACIAATDGWQARVGDRIGRIVDRQGVPTGPSPADAPLRCLVMQPSARLPGDDGATRGAGSRDSFAHSTGTFLAPDTARPGPDDPTLRLIPVQGVADIVRLPASLALRTPGDVVPCGDGMAVILATPDRPHSNIAA